MSEYFYNVYLYLKSSFNFFILTSSFSRARARVFSSFFLSIFYKVSSQFPLAPLSSNLYLLPISPFKHNSCFCFNSTQSTHPLFLLFAIPIFFSLAYLKSFSWPLLLNISIFFYFGLYVSQISYPNSRILSILFCCCTSRCLYHSSFLMCLSLPSLVFWNFDWITVEPYIILLYFLNFLFYTFVSIPFYTSLVTEITMHDVLPL